MANVTNPMKIPCNKGKIITTVDGHFFQVECWAKHPKGCSFGLLWPSKLEKAMNMELKRKKVFLAHLFMKIMEIRRKWI